MGVLIRVPEFEIEMPDTWGNNVEEVVESLSKHYDTFAHFLAENAGSVGTVNVRSREGGFHKSVDFVFGEGLLHTGQ